MKKYLSNIATIFLFIIGLAVISYPFISNWYNQRNQGEIINNYDDTVSQMEEEKLRAEKDAARFYNESLLEVAVLTDPFDEGAFKKSTDEYESLLNINGDGIMGYIQIPKINVRLPIFHGTSSEVLEKGAGHLENTSLPIGGIATHAVLSSHTGLPAAKLFTDLPKMEEGDLFYLVILNETLAYQVDNIVIVEPTDTSHLQIDNSQDYVTLVTCTPYGVNSHRLLVRGTRVELIEEDEIAIAELETGGNIHWIFIISLTFILVLFLFWKKAKTRRKGERRNKK